MKSLHNYKIPCTHYVTLSKEKICYCFQQLNLEFVFNQFSLISILSKRTKIVNNYENDKNINKLNVLL